MASDRKTRRRAYTPALRFHAFTGYFDALMARSLKEARFRQLLLDQLGAVHAMVVHGHDGMDGEPIRD